MWFKKNLAVLLIGFIVGIAIAGSIGYPLHRAALKSQSEAHHLATQQDAEIIENCVERPTHLYQNTNEFNPEIGKNKKGVIEIKTFPDIEQSQQLELPINPKELINETIRAPKKPPNDTNDNESKPRRGKGNW